MSELTETELFALPARQSGPSNADETRLQVCNVSYHYFFQIKDFRMSKLIVKKIDAESLKELASRNETAYRDLVAAIVNDEEVDENELLRIAFATGRTAANISQDAAGLKKRIDALSELAKIENGGLTDEEKTATADLQAAIENNRQVAEQIKKLQFESNQTYQNALAAKDSIDSARRIRLERATEAIRTTTNPQAARQSRKLGEQAQMLTVLDKCARIPAEEPRLANVVKADADAAREMAADSVQGFNWSSPAK
jgi:hypothetical protein